MVLTHWHTHFRNLIQILQPTCSQLPYGRSIWVICSILLNLLKWKPLHLLLIPWTLRSVRCNLVVINLLVFLTILFHDLLLRLSNSIVATFTPQKFWMRWVEVVLRLRRAHYNRFVGNGSICLVEYTLCSKRCLINLLLRLSPSMHRFMHFIFKCLILRL